MLKLKIISKKQYDELIDLLKRSLDVVKTLEAERDHYKRSWEELLKCVNVKKDQLSSMYGETNSIDFPATTKVEKPENKLF